MLRHLLQPICRDRAPRKSSNRERRAALTGPRCRPLRLEPLEDRCLLAVGGLAAAGDSLTDEYVDPDQGFPYAMTWFEALGVSGVNVGDFRVDPDTWGDVREQGYEYNWAQAGATSGSLLADGQHTGLAQQVNDGDVTHAVLAIGQNDYWPLGPAYQSIYAGLWTEDQIDTHNQGILANIATALDTLVPTGVKLVISNVADYGVAPFVRMGATDVAGRQRVADAVSLLNQGIKELANVRGLPMVDLYGLTKDYLGEHGAEIPSQTVGGVEITNTFGADPHNAFVGDGIHPHTIVQANLGNCVNVAINQGYGENLELLSEQEMLNLAGIGGEYTGPTFSLDPADYVVFQEDVVREGVFPYTIAVIDLHLPNGSQETVVVAGPATVRWYYEGENEGDAQDDDGDGLDEVVTEVVEIELTGTSSQGEFTVRLNSAVPSEGEIEEQTNVTPGVLDVSPFAVGVGDSGLEVYFEFDANGTVLHNETPLELHGETTVVPSAPGDVLVGADEVDLFDDLGDPSGFSIEVPLVSLDPGPDFYDFGDAPEPYPTLKAAEGARHYFYGHFYLGSDIDCEPDGLPTPGADGDDVTDSDDEDGVLFPGALVPGEQTTVAVNVTDIMVSFDGWLNAWIDLDQNGDWQGEGERVISQLVNDGPNEIQILLPEDAAVGPTYARFRLGADSDTDLGPEGFCGAGEVEDYRVIIVTEDFGNTTLTERDGLDPSSGDVWYRLETSQAGPLRIEATYGWAGGGDAALTLYDANENPLASSSTGSGLERIEHEAAGAGEVYYVKLEGDNVDVDLRVQNPVLTVREDVHPYTVCEIRLKLADGSEERVTVAGTATVRTYFEGDNEGDARDHDGDGLDEVKQEVVELELKGTSSQGPVTVRLNPALRSVGDTEEQANATPGVLDVSPFAEGVGNSSFEVFVEVTVDGTVLHNQTPLQLVGVATSVPSAPGDALAASVEVGLADVLGMPSGYGIEVAFLELEPGPNRLDWGDAPESYPTLRAADGAAHLQCPWDEDTGTQSLSLGSSVSVSSSKFEESQPEVI